MEAKAPSSAYATHMETRLSFETAESPIISIQLPSTSTFARTSKALRKVLPTLPISRTEGEYRNRRIATASGVHFRSRKRYPRNILWRCLEDNKVVELRSLDLSKSHNEPKDKEANLILRLGFPSQIIKDGIALADSEAEDTLSLFILTTGNELYTITLKPALFYKVTASEDDFDRRVRIYKPALLSIASAFRLHAANSLELFVALGDGRLLRLIRKSGDDGLNWTETAYSDGQWGSSLRGLLRWSGGSNTLTYDGTTLDYNTFLNTIPSPDHEHILSVSLNHTIKFWNLKTGRVNITRDILNIERDPQDFQKILIHPSTRKVLDAFECQSGFGGDLYYAVTFSPHSSGVFKFWGVRNADNAEFGVRDLFEDDILKAPEPDDGALWTVADFSIQANTFSADIDVWILMRLNRRYQIYKRHFSDLQTLGREWSEGWSVTVIDPAKSEPSNEAPLSVLGQASISERWLTFLTAPGRFTQATLETALMSFADGRRLQLPKNSKSSLEERISSTIGSQIHLLATDLEPDFSNFEDRVAQEWISFWKTITEIDLQHWEPMALAFDKSENALYSVFGAGFSVIRELSELEKLTYNIPVELQKYKDLSITQSIEADGSTMIATTPDQLAAVIEAAARFRLSFSKSLKSCAQIALQNELWKDASLATPERIQAFYDACDFETEIGDRAYNNIVASLRSPEGSPILRTDVILAILETFSNQLPLQNEQEMSTSIGTVTGTKILARGVGDLLAIRQRVLADLLYLIVFINIEADQESGIAEQLDANHVYLRILEYLREVQITLWLAAQTVQVPSLHVQNPEETRSNHLTISVLERDFLRIYNPRAATLHGQATALTQSIRDVQTWVCGANEIEFDGVLVNIQCVFLKEQNIDLASSFARFQSSSAWSTYIGGRLHLIKYEFIEAAQLFKKAASRLGKCVIGLENNTDWFAARGRASEIKYTVKSAGLIQPTEQALLSSGLTNYYNHIVDLFATHHAHAQVLTFAELALQHCGNDSTAQRSDLLSRLFHASATTMDYSIAYTALLRYTDKALQRSALAELITRMVSNGYANELLNFPLLSLKKDFERILHDKAQSEINLRVSATPVIPYFKILYAFHIRHRDFRAAASILVSRLEARHQRRETANAKQTRFLHSKQEAEKALDEYLIGINALALLAPDDDDDSDAEDEAWVFVEGDSTTQQDQSPKKRRVMLIEELRERYESEMDRVASIELGRWGIVEDEEEEEEEEEIDEEDEDEMEGVQSDNTQVAIL